MLGFDGKFLAVHPKAKFRRFLVKYRKRSALKHFTGNQEMSRKCVKCLDLIASSKPSTQQPNLDVSWEKNCKEFSSKALHRKLGNFKKSDCKKHSIEKSIFLNFVNLFPTFCPRLQSLFLILLKAFRPSGLQLYRREISQLVFQDQPYVDTLENRCS